MIAIPNAQSPEVLVIGMQAGDRLLESIQDACARHGVRNGVVVSGIGTLKNVRIHYITDIRLPPTEGFVNVEKPLELLSMSGVIADGAPHLHVTVSCMKEPAFGGHLEPGSEIAYLAEVVILKFAGLEMCRRADANGIKLLGPK